MRWSISVQELSDKHGRRISLVGWSLGGLYARQLAKMMPGARAPGDHARQPPFAGDPRSTNAWRVYEWASGRKSDEVDPQFGGELAVPPPVPTTAIFSRTDGVCAWQGCMEKTGAQTESIEVESSHCGMGPSSRRRLCGRRPASRRRKASGGRSTAAAGAAWSIPIRIGKRGLHGSRRAALPRSSHED
jgi:hypothetical protein